MGGPCPFIALFRNLYRIKGQQLSLGIIFIRQLGLLVSVFHERVEIAKKLSHHGNESKFLAHAFSLTPFPMRRDHADRHDENYSVEVLYQFWEPAGGIAEGERALSPALPRPAGRGF
jgi:hypothetical protein